MFNQIKTIVLLGRLSAVLIACGACSVHVSADERAYPLTERDGRHGVFLAAVRHHVLQEFAL